MSPKLKHKKGRQVAPLAGAWIEICEQIADLNEYSVAPLAGAWIEMYAYGYCQNQLIKSLPSRERGLKLSV